MVLDDTVGVVPSAATSFAAVASPAGRWLPSGRFLCARQNAPSIPEHTRGRTAGKAKPTWVRSASRSEPVASSPCNVQKTRIAQSPTHGEGQRGASGFTQRKRSVDRDHGFRKRHRVQHASCANRRICYQSERAGIASPCRNAPPSGREPAEEWPMRSPLEQLGLATRN